MRRFLLMSSACVALAVCASAGARTQTVTPVTETATLGNVHAELYYVFDDVGFPRYRDLSITISRNGNVVAATSPQPGPIDSYWPGNAGKQGVKSVRIANLDGAGEPEVAFDIYSGGAHCCHSLWVYRWTGMVYTSVEMGSGSSPYRQRDLDHDGKPEWVAADPRFEYLFTPFSASAMPIRVYNYRAGTFNVVTKSFRSSIQNDMARWWRYYQQQRKATPHDNRGLLAAWSADMYLLGKGANVWPVMGQALKRGDLTRPPGSIGPSGRVYISKLRQKLSAFGY